MRLQWTDSYEVALALQSKFPEQDPEQLEHSVLIQWVLELDDFDDDPELYSDVILQAIQQAWACRT